MVCEDSHTVSERPQIVETTAGELHLYDMVDEGRHVFSWWSDGQAVRVGIAVPEPYGPYPEVPFRRCLRWEKGLEERDYQWDEVVRVMRGVAIDGDSPGFPCGGSCSGLIGMPRRVDEGAPWTAQYVEVNEAEIGVMPVRAVHIGGEWGGWANVWPEHQGDYPWRAFNGCVKL